ncbi:MAG TPA: hypothetical protein VFR87_08165 [Nocardioidaceae bacterium]|nr:hypothetical protein [Nocardioidaceae bacterium]
MSEPQNGTNQPSDAEKDLAEHERPEKGLISDEELPEDLQPTDDNPLAKDPDDGDESTQGGPAGSAGTVEGMPDMGNPGAPA